MTFSELTIGMLPLGAPGLGSGLLVVALDIACNQMVPATFQHPDQQTNLCAEPMPSMPLSHFGHFWAASRVPFGRSSTLRPHGRCGSIIGL